MLCQEGMTYVGMSVDSGFCSDGDSIESSEQYACLVDKTTEKSNSLLSKLNQKSHVSLATPASRACYEALVHPGMISHLSPKVSVET